MARTPEAAASQVQDAMCRLRLCNIKCAADPWWLEDLDFTAKLLASGASNASFS
jgi:hypothetical protein